MSGALRDRYEYWRRLLIDALAHLEAVIDFPDEDLPPDVAAKVWNRVAVLDADIRMITSTMAAAANRSARVSPSRSSARPMPESRHCSTPWPERDAAIVAADAGHHPGCHRRSSRSRSGYAVTLADTAGLREAGDEIENEGIRRAHIRAETADIEGPATVRRRALSGAGCRYQRADRQQHGRRRHQSRCYSCRSDEFCYGRAFYFRFRSGAGMTTRSRSAHSRRQSAHRRSGGQRL